MIRRLVTALAFSIVASFASIAPAFAIDVNTADEAQLQTIKGIGPAISARIVAERKKGNFKDWSDFQSRVNGIGDKTSVSLSQNGLTVGGAAKANAPAVAAPAKAAAPPTPPAPVAPIKKAEVPAPAPPAMTKAAPVVAPVPMAKPAPPVAPVTPAPKADAKTAKKAEPVVDDKKALKQKKADATATTPATK